MKKLDGFYKLCLGVAGNVNLSKLGADILPKVDGHYASPAFLQAMIDANRANSVQGEMLFFYEGLEKASCVF